MPLTKNIKKLAESKALANLLSKHVVLGNLTIAAFVGYSLYSIVESFLPQIELMQYEQRPITQSDMTAICENKDFYRRKLRRDYDLGKEITPQGVRYRKYLTDVYPVFRWVCQYKIVESVGFSSLKEPTGSSESAAYKDTGLSLDEYHCELHFADSELTKATYLDPNNPHSWVCTNANPNLDRQVL